MLSQTNMWNAFSRWFRAVVSAGNGQPSSQPDDRYFRILAENSGDVLCHIGLDFQIKYASPSAEAVLGWLPQALIGRLFTEMIVAEDMPRIAAARAHEQSTGESGRAQFRFRRSDGTLAWVEGTGRMLPGGDTVVVFRDISDRKQLEDQLSALAATDALTGLANRRIFDETLDREWRRALRESTAVSLLLLDIDHFKGFNDRYGHQVGDDCIRTVGLTLQKVVHRPGDLTARYGGEELAVILCSTDSAGALHVAEELRQAIRALQIPHAANTDHGGVVTVSIGVATAIGAAGGTIKMPHGVLSAADHALYQAKHDGRNRVASSLLLAQSHHAA